MALIGMGHFQSNPVMGEWMSLTQSFLSEEEPQQLQSLVNPLSLSNSHGIDLYMQTRAFVTSTYG